MQSCRGGAGHSSLLLARACHLRRRQRGQPGTAGASKRSSYCPRPCTLPRAPTTSLLPVSTTSHIQHPTSLLLLPLQWQEPEGGPSTHLVKGVALDEVPGRRAALVVQEVELRNLGADLPQLRALQAALHKQVPGGVGGGQAWRVLCWTKPCFLFAASLAAKRKPGRVARHLQPSTVLPLAPAATGSTPK